MWKPVNPFYKTIRWRNKRENILRRDEYLCRDCRRYGKSTQADTVHHCYPLEQYPDLAMVDDNLISLCNSCHGQMHNRIDGTLTVKGIEWQNRNRRKIEKVIQWERVHK